MPVVVTGEVLVHLARGVRFDGRALTLVDLAPATIRVKVTSATEIGHVCTGTVLDRWTHASMASRGRTWRVPGTLALLDSEAQVAGDAVVVVSNPRVTADGLAYDADVVGGAVPSQSGACVLSLEWGAAPRVP
jgi:hypothetical protein